MPKSRLSVLDVSAVAAEMRATLIGMRVINIYDLDAKTFIFKLGRTGAAKRFLVMQSGVRAHESRYEREMPTMPSSFSMKLRKHLRGQRLNAVAQLGTDRVLDFLFGLGDRACHVILEMYDRGNVVLTDRDYTILQVLRRHDYGDGAMVAVKSVYPIAQAARSALELQAEGQRADAEKEESSGAAAALATEDEADGELGDDAEAADDGADNGDAVAEGSDDEGRSDRGEIGASSGGGIDLSVDRLKEMLAHGFERALTGKAKSKATLRALLSTKGSGVSDCGPALIDHAIVSAGLQPKRKIVAGAPVLTDSEIEALVVAVRGLPTILHEIQSSPCKGYLLCKVKSAAAPPFDSTPGQTAVSADDIAVALGDEVKSLVPKDAALEDFTPVLLAQHLADYSEEGQVIELPRFSDAVDEFFARLEAAKDSKGKKKAKSAAEKRVERLKDQTAASLAAMQQQQRAAAAKAERITQHLTEVDQAIAVVKSALDSGMDWNELERIVQRETQAGNPIASLIRAMDLKQHRITLRLRDLDAPPSEAESDDEFAAVRGDDGAESDSGGEDAVSRDDTAAGGAGGAPGGDPATTSAGAATGKAKARTGSGKAKRTRGKHGRKEPHVKTRKRGGLGDAESVTTAVSSSAWAADGTPPVYLNVSVDVYESAAANASLYFGASKDARSKEERAVAKTAGAIRHAEKRVEAEQRRKAHQIGGGRKAISIARKPFWFEKFQWFMSSEGLVVVAGRDAQQNEQLVKRYLRPQDIFVHAAEHGAATCIVRNASNDPQAADLIPAQTLAEAGAYTVCLSHLWASGTPGASWWVYAHQVSKTAPSGEYLSVGSFMIRGKKNMLPPARLEAAYCLLWMLDDASAARHAGERAATAKWAAGPAAAPAEGAEETKDEGVGADATELPDSGGAGGAAGVGSSASSDRVPSEGAEDANPTTEAVPETADVPPVATAGLAGVEGGSADEQQTAQDDNSHSRKKPAISAAEKRKRKKAKAKARRQVESGGPDDSAAAGGAGTAGEAATAEELEALDDGEEDAASGGGASEPKGKGDAAPTALKRGQRQRRRKQKAKYADQDDEERRLAMKALGHTVDTAADGDGEAASAGAAAAGPRESGRATEAAADERPSDSVADPDKPRGPSRRERARQANAEIHNLMAEEYGEQAAAALAAREAGVESDNKTGEAGILAAMTPKPKPEDTLLACIPMCAPYAATAAFKYRIKVQPGKLKKGKAAREAVAMLLRWSDANKSEREKELIRMLGDKEIVPPMLGNSRVSPPGPTGKSNAPGGGKGKGRRGGGSKKQRGGKGKRAKGER